MAAVSKRIAAEHRKAIFKEIGSRLRNSIGVVDEAVPENMTLLLAKLQAKAS